jgi:hypothetical protein
MAQGLAIAEWMDEHLHGPAAEAGRRFAGQQLRRRPGDEDLDAARINQVRAALPEVRGLAGTADADDGEGLARNRRRLDLAPGQRRGSGCKGLGELETENAGSAGSTPASR